MSNFHVNALDFLLLLLVICLLSSALLGSRIFLLSSRCVVLQGMQFIEHKFCGDACAHVCHFGHEIKSGGMKRSSCNYGQEIVVLYVSAVVHHLLL
jgi:hypothetical protein